MNSLTFFIYIGSGILCAVLIYKFFICHFPKELQNAAYVVTILLFILCGAGLFAVSAIKSAVSSFVNDKAVRLEYLITYNNPDSKLVKNGYDISLALDAVKEFRNYIPDKISNSEIINTIYKESIEISLNILQENIDMAASYSNDGYINASSIIYGIKNSVLERFYEIFFYVRMAILFILLIYIGYCAYTAYEEKKKQKEQDNF